MFLTKRERGPFHRARRSPCVGIIGRCRLTVGLEEKMLRILPVGCLPIGWVDFTATSLPRRTLQNPIQPTQRWLIPRGNQERQITWDPIVRRHISSIKSNYCFLGKGGGGFQAGIEFRTCFNRSRARAEFRSFGFSCCFSNTSPGTWYMRPSM